MVNPVTKTEQKDVEKLKEAIEEKYKDSSLVGLGNVDKLIAQKTEGMMDLYSSTLLDPYSGRTITMPRKAMGIAMLYLGKIDSEDPDKYYVFITAEELKGALGGSEIKKERLIQWLTYLQSPCHLVKYEGKRIVNFFTDSQIIYAENGKMLGVRLACSQYAKDYIFNLKDKKIKYIKVMVGSVLRFKSEFSIMFFDEVIDAYYQSFGYEGGHEVEWTVSVGELREILRRNEPFSYKFNEFKRNVLDRCMDDVNEFSCYHVEIDESKKAYHHIEELTFKIRKDINELDVDVKEEHRAHSKYKHYDDFATFDEYLEYKNSFAPHQQEEMEAINETIDQNNRTRIFVTMLEGTVKRERYSKDHIRWLARLMQRFFTKRDQLMIDSNDDTYYLSEPDDLLNIINDYEAAAEANVTSTNRYAFAKYVIRCFENYIKQYWGEQ